MSSLYGIPIAIVILALACKLSGTALRNYFLHKMTVVNEIPKLGIPRADKDRIKGTAVICGGSIAGLWAARICADHFEEVLIVEPEEWAASEEAGKGMYDVDGSPRVDSYKYQRKRVYQYNSVHGFQPMALRALRRLFHNFDEEVKRTDGRILVGVDVNFCSHGALIARPPIQEYSSNLREIENFFMSRDSYERILRGLVRKSSNRIRWLVATGTGVKISPGGSDSVQSVIVRGADGIEKEVPATLVIDCTGSTQAGFKWLKHVYFSESPLARNNNVSFDALRVNYKTFQSFIRHRIFVPEEIRAQLPIPGGYDNAGFIFVFVPKAGEEKCFFIITRIEGHRIDLNFGGWNSPPTPTSVEDINDYLLNFEAASSIPSWLCETVDTLIRAKGKVETERISVSDMSWIRYEIAPYVPSNFVAIGDSVMCLNPTYGQGCSKAAIGAITLDGLLRSDTLRNSDNIPSNFGLRFFKAHKFRIMSTWDGSKPMDYKYESTVPIMGEKRSDTDFPAAFSSAVIN